MPEAPEDIRDAEIMDGEPTAEEFQAAADLPENYLELYKLAVEMADRVSARRSVANSFFLTINTGLVAVLASAADLRWYLPVAGLLFCVTWWTLLKSYRDLNSAKFQIILGMEEKLPVRVYADEKGIYRSEPPIRFSFRLRRAELRKWIAQYRELTRVERIVPMVFGVIYIAELIRQVIE